MDIPTSSSDDSSCSYLQVGPADSLPPGRVSRFVVGDRAIAIANVNGRLWAFEDRCLHWGVRLSDGVLDGDVMRCRAHGWRHSLSKGEVVASNPPGDEGLRLTRYPAKVQDGYIWVGTLPRCPGPDS
ncbi:Rieske (2Fe-2S) protein [Pusillimonas noertemannii]|uniref:Rieske (2Fe-2S) protein n=1 Tax=Pusillimonas noertemannii TaxID=305977 RepID=UPI00333F1E84